MLDQISLQILELHNRFSLKRTLFDAAAIGERLEKAKKLLPHGEFLPWVKKLGVSPRTAQRYMQANATDLTQFDGDISLDRFLRIVVGRPRVVPKVPDTLARNNRQQQIHHTDCRDFAWPKNIPMIFTDPPWKDMDAYKWLNDMAGDHLADDGILLVQCGQHYLSKVLSIMTARPYLWTLAIVYNAMGGKPMANYISNWRPILVFGPNKKLPISSDTYLVSNTNGSHKKHHPWEQPTKPYRYWIARYAPSLVVDPFCGSGTIGCVCKELGLSYIGTEISETHFKIARNRLAEHIRNEGDKS